jgi:alkanesulfonate monooxygenase SsuD/methylene tetrahydromethanopterin reductase-like flavin-dependent oxidoreductase (luciferase family)
MGETRWGVWLHAVKPVPELAEFAVAAESLGAAAILVADEGTDRDLFVTLAALAQHTRKVLLFGAVTNPHSRHPVALASAYASLAELAPGRIVAGFGVGGSRVFAPLGLAPARPYTTLRECLDVVQALWRGESVSHVGEFRVNAAQLTWPLRERIPLAVAGRGPRVERLAADRADWFLVAGRLVDALPGLFQRLRDARHRPSIAWNPVAAWTDAMREDLRGHLAYMAADMPDADRPQVITDSVLERYAIVGDRTTVAARLAELRASLQPELLVFDAGDYSPKFLESLASLALDAGARAFHN